MVVGLIVLGACVVLATGLICFKGVTVTYHKDFTVRDDRAPSVTLSEEQLKTLEKDLNKAGTPLSTPLQEDSKEPIVGPMDSVIGEIQDLFGPDRSEGD